MGAGVAECSTADRGGRTLQTRQGWSLELMNMQGFKTDGGFLDQIVVLWKLVKNSGNATRSKVVTCRLSTFGLSILQNHLKNFNRRKCISCFVGEVSIPLQLSTRLSVSLLQYLLIQSHNVANSREKVRSRDILHSMHLYLSSNGRNHWDSLETTDLNQDITCTYALNGVNRLSIDLPRPVCFSGEDRSNCIFHYRGSKVVASCLTL